jgi:hypothetical protein
MTAIWAILDLIVYRTENNSLHLIFNFPLAKIYTISLMSTLNSRRSHTENSNTVTAGQSGGGFMSDNSTTSGNAWATKSGRGGGSSTNKTEFGMTASMPKWGRHNSGQVSTCFRHHHLPCFPFSLLSSLCWSMDQLSWPLHFIYLI